ncbi:MAG TPA: hypothetical protein VG498_08555 [Terriglobales bacterium]|nr:hypothetical protein [Terriglobales bacterium]
MRYQAYRPYGRRRTDNPLSADERKRLEEIRHDVDEDSSGLIRRYLRLASKVLDESNQPKDEKRSAQKEQFRSRAA